MDGKDLKAIRLSIALNTREFSKLLGKSIASVSRWESGKIAIPDFELSKLQAIKDLIIQKDSSLIEYLESVNANDEADNKEIILKEINRRATIIIVDNASSKFSS